MNILTVNLLFSTLVFWVAAKIYLLPRLRELKPKNVLLPILLLHSFPSGLETDLPSYTSASYYWFQSKAN